MKKLLNTLLVSILALFVGFAQPVNAGIISKTLKGAAITVVAKKVAPTIIKSVAKNIVKKESKKVKSLIAEELRKNELSVGKYKDLVRMRPNKKNNGLQDKRLEAHHMPSNKYMNNKGVDRNDGIAMEMSPSRHSKTRSYGNGKQNMTETPRESLARDIKDTKNIYKNDGQYNKEVRKSLQDVIRKNKEIHPELFSK